jgi:hypothetical protein
MLGLQKSTPKPSIHPLARVIPGTHPRKRRLDSGSSQESRPGTPPTAVDSADIRHGTAPSRITERACGATSNPDSPVLGLKSQARDTLKRESLPQKQTLPGINMLCRNTQKSIGEWFLAQPTWIPRHNVWLLLH